jgi:acetyl esterase/lipase
MFSPSPTPAAHFGIRWGALVLVLVFTRTVAAEFDVRTRGATGDGQTLDTAAIHRAIAAASAAGGGTVRSPAGILLSFSIRLKNNLTRHLDAGATLLAAPPPIFLAIFHGDRGVSAQAVYLYLALKKAAVPPEVHEWGDGGHDYCIHPGTTPHTTYPALAADWMAVRG